MFWSVISEQDVFSDNDNFIVNNSTVCNFVRSSNPYDYVRAGYFIDNASMFGGKNLVNLNCNFSGNSSGNNFFVSRV